MLDLRRQTEAAASAERFQEADALQGELDAASRAMEAAGATHGFSDADLGPALGLLGGSAAAAAAAGSSLRSSYTGC